MFLHVDLLYQDDVESNEKFQALQEELIAVKLREAESNLALRELANHVTDLDKEWQVYIGSAEKKHPGVFLLFMKFRIKI